MFGILVDWQIQNLCEGQKLVEPFDSALLNPSSLDIRVGKSALFRTISNKPTWQEIDLSITTEESPYFFYPGEKLLVSSLEIFNLPSDVCAQFVLKSSRAREFYGHQLAGFCDPGWHSSSLTMELSNDDLDALPLYYGMRIGQMIFFQLSYLPKKDYSQTGRYNGDKQVQESRG